MDGYQALAKCLTEYTPEQVIQIVTDSGLRGRGGGGFPTGRKWSLCAPIQGAAEIRGVQRRRRRSGRVYGSFGAGRATPTASWKLWPSPVTPSGPPRGFVYVRAEYPIAVRRLQIAIDEAREAGLLGKDIFGSGFEFDMEIRLGAGAFVCGEETALMTSIEGNRGEPGPGRLIRRSKDSSSSPTVEKQRRDLCQYPADHPEGRRLVRFHGHREVQGNQGVRARRQNQTYRLGGNPNGHYSAGDRGGNRRRHPGREEIQGRADRRSLRRLYSGLPHRHQDRLRQSDRHGLHDGLRRPDRHGRGYLHGGYRQVLPGIHG